MPVVRYTTTGAFGNRGVTAFAPAPPRTPSVFSLKMAQNQTPVFQPGTQGVPAPRDAVSGDDSAPALGGGLSGSQFMPPAWYPTLGYQIQRIWGGIGGVRIFSDNLMPIPATDPRRIPAGATGPMAQAGTMMPPARPNRRLGQRQIRWPVRAPRWGGINGG